MIPKDHFALQRVPPFEAWKRRKFLVLHMQTPFLDVETCLKLANIPFKALAYDEIKMEDDLVKEISDSFGIIITGSWLGKKISRMKPEIPRAIYESPLPKLGLCFGHEEFGKYLGARLVECNPPFGEQSETEVKLFQSPLFEGLDLDADYIVFMAHDYMLDEVPENSELIAQTRITPIAGFQCLSEKMFGLQFHPEKGWLGDLVFRNFYRYCSDSSS